MTFVLYRSQRRAKAALRAAIERDEWPLRLTGHAGTGKTALVAQLPRLLGIDPAKVLFVSPTNKACEVLRGKDVQSEVRTCAKELWVWECTHTRRCEEGRERHGSKCYHKEPKRDANEYKLVVCDESSMVNYEDYGQLLPRRTLFVGDPGQLPPILSTRERGVVGEGWSSLQDKPTAHLTQIVRQAAGSPILKAAYAVREGGTGDLDLADYRELWQEWQEEDPCDVMVVVAMHKVRSAHNEAARAARGWDGGLRLGDRLLCKANYPDLGVFNGTLGTAVGQGKGCIQFRPDGESRDVPVPLADILPGGKFADEDGDKWLYGYAITAHAAQGSEWKHVAVDESGVDWLVDKRGWDGPRWRYTAYTRASESLCLTV